MERGDALEHVGLERRIVQGALCARRCDERRCHRIHGDAERPPLDRQALRQVGDSRFRHAVDRFSWERHEPRLRAEVHDASAALADHVTADGLAHEERALEVDRTRQIIVAFVDLLRRVLWGDPGVVHENVDAAEARHGLIDGRRNLCEVGDVHLERKRRAAECLNLAGQAAIQRHVAAPERHVRPGMRQRECGRPSKTARRARDERDLIRQRERRKVRHWVIPFVKLLHNSTVVSKVRAIVSPEMTRPAALFTGACSILAIAGALLSVTVAVASRQPVAATAWFAQPPTTAWPTYNGDYSGRRFSPLSRINAKTVSALSLAWVYRADAGATRGGGVIKSTPLQIDGVLYFTVPDHVWAVDARSGRERWHYTWPSTGGNHLANRGVAVLGEWLFFETPDCHLVSLNVKDGRERWRTSICDLELFYYGASAPVIIGHHVITGISGDDLDNPGYVESHDPVTGALQWRWYTVPQKKGDPGADTWPNEDAMLHGGGMTWLPVTYDPELNLMYLTTGNPHPVMANRNREGSNLFTGCIIALSPDTGKMAWYFQPMPHDTHDWDATETPVLIDTADRRPAAHAPGAGVEERYLLRARSCHGTAADLHRSS